MQYNTHRPITTLLRTYTQVFEIGFGLGYSADAIQQRSPKKHVIIDCDPVVLKRAREWAKNKAGVQIIEGESVVLLFIIIYT